MKNAICPKKEKRDFFVSSGNSSNFVERIKIGNCNCRNSLKHILWCNDGRNDIITYGKEIWNNYANMPYVVMCSTKNT